MITAKKYKSPKEKLTDRAIRSYAKYGYEGEYIRQLLEVRLNQIASVYTMQNNLPKESVKVVTRVKSLQSFLKKLEAKDWKDFYNLEEIADDLIGARIICWFVKDCYGMLELIKSTNQLHIDYNSFNDYIHKPKKSGYRSIHFNADIKFDKVLREKNSKTLKFGEGKMPCEIQIRTKMQDVFGELTHDFHYKDGKEVTKKIPALDNLVEGFANRLAAEDASIEALRDIYLTNTPRKVKKGS